MIVFMARYKRPFRFPPHGSTAVIHQLPTAPRLIPTPLRQTMPAYDDGELANLYMAQCRLAPSLGLKIQLAYEALVKLVGEPEAQRQVFAIVQDYLQESVA